MSNKFENFYSKKPVAELIQSLLSHKINPNLMDQVWYEALIIHLSKREMNEENRSLVDKILNSDTETLQKENVHEKITPEVINSAKLEYANGKKYPVLGTLSVAVAIIAWIIAGLTITIVLTLLNNLGDDGSWVLPVGIFALGSIFFIALLAYSEIIKVFVDIEENTRKAALR